MAKDDPAPVEDAAPLPDQAQPGEPSDEPSVRQRIVAGIVGVLLLALVAGYAVLPCPVSYEDRAMLDEVRKLSVGIVVAPCHFKPGGEASDMGDLVVDQSQAMVLSAAEQAELANILDRDRWLFMGRLTKPDCWEPHHVVLFQQEDGGSFALQLSLDCGRFKAGGFSPRPLPAMWHWRFKRWLRDLEANHEPQ